VSIRQGLLALLAEEPAGAYQLRQEFERRTGGTWPLNMGQVSTTLDRLVRDGLVVVDVGADVPRYGLTDEGGAALATWWATPVERSAPARDELAIKLALAVTATGVDVRAIVQAQRTECMRGLRDVTRLVAQVPTGAVGSGDLAWSLVLDNLVFAAEAEIRWLDHVEARLARAASSRPDAGATPPSSSEPTAPPASATLAPERVDR